MAAPVGRTSTSPAAPGVTGVTGGIARAKPASAPGDRTATGQVAPASADLLSVQDLPTRVAQAADRTRQVQHQAQAAQAAERSTRTLEPQIRQLRDLARQASAAGLSAEQRSELKARFDSLQTRVRISAAATTYQGRGLGDYLNARTQADQAPAAELVVSGNALVDGQRVEEGGAVLAESQVARERGLTAARATVDQGTAVFRFEDAGDGRVRATRYQRQEGELVAVGSQTAAVPGLRGQRLAGGQPAAVEFERLGLSITLGARYVGGDLDQLQLEATAPAAPTPAPAPARTPDDQALTFDIGEAAGARRAAAALEEMLTRAAQLRRELRAEQAARRQEAVQGLQDTEAASGAAAPLDAGTARAVTASLGQRMLQQSAAALAAQGSPDRQRTVDLLG